jgi:site-specific recombinase XerD
MEVDNLVDKKFWKITRDTENNVDVLNIYQTKLTSLSKDQRWKPIPVFFKEQKEALNILLTSTLKRPLNKTIQSYLNDEDYESYSPRKGFTDLMLERGFALEDISTFLGHNDINTTWRHYKNKKKFRLPPTG